MQQVTFDYRKRKDAGAVRLAKQGDKYVVILRNFDSQTGAEVNATQVEVDLKDLDKQMTALKEQMAALTEFMNDLKATTVTLGALLSGNDQVKP